MKKFYTQTELRKLFRKLETSHKRGNTQVERDRLFFTLQYYTGSRVSEICNLKVENLSGDNLYVKRLKGSLSITFNLKELIGTKYLKKLKRYIREHGCEYIFTQRKYGKLKHQGDKLHYRNMLIRFKKFGDTKKSTHALRHSRAIHMLENGLELFEVKSIMGHVNVQNTTIYLEYTSKISDNIINKLNGKDFTL